MSAVSNGHTANGNGHSELTEWYRELRPTSFKQVLGQPEAVLALSKMVKERKVPHALLFTGPSGVGKTTSALILKNKLGCVDRRDFDAINFAEARGIDTVRYIAARKGMAPWGGKCRMWLLDECFPPDAKVSTPRGWVPISHLKKGDELINLQGISQVEEVFCNRIALHRLVKVYWSDGTDIVTTESHKFLTNFGWVEAGDLTPGDFIWRQHEQAGPEKASSWTSEACFDELRRVRQGNDEVLELKQAVLQPTLCRTVEESATFLVGISAYSRSQEGTKRKEKEVPQNAGWYGKESKGFCPDVCQQPFPHARRHRKGYEDQGVQRDSSRVEGEKRGQRDIHASTSCLVESVGGSEIWLGHGLGDPYRTISFHSEVLEGRHQVPKQLQGGCWQRGSEIRNRGRWESPQIEKGYASRCEKDGLSRCLGVDRVEVYEPGRNDEAFLGIVSSQDRNRGFVEFYDLQVMGHPSYFVNGLPVHNCHRATSDAQSAMLEILENTPAHLYFVLCTDQPNKVARQIHTRCTEVKFKPLTDADLRTVLDDVLTAKGADLFPSVVAKIIDAAEGSARKAVVFAQQAALHDTEEAQLAAVEKPSASRQAEELFNLLTGKARPQWAKVADVLRNLEEEPEELRRRLLGYVAKAMLAGGQRGARAFELVQLFSFNYQDSGKAGLYASCWEAVRKS